MLDAGGTGATNSYRYICNRNSGEIHRVIASSAGRDSLEVCNLDDMLDDQELEEEAALRLVAADPKRRCGHCWPARAATESETETEGA